MYSLETVVFCNSKFPNFVEYSFGCLKCEDLWLDALFSHAREKKAQAQRQDSGRGSDEKARSGTEKAFLERGSLLLPLPGDEWRKACLSAQDLASTVQA